MPLYCSNVYWQVRVSPILFFGPHRTNNIRIVVNVVVVENFSPQQLLLAGTIQTPKGTFAGNNSPQNVVIL